MAAVKASVMRYIRVLLSHTCRRSYIVDVNPVESNVYLSSCRWTRIRRTKSLCWGLYAPLYFQMSSKSLNRKSSTRLLLQVSNVACMPNLGFWLAPVCQMPFSSRAGSLPLPHILLTPLNIVLCNRSGSCWCQSCWTQVLDKEWWTGSYTSPF